MKSRLDEQGLVFNFPPSNLPFNLVMQQDACQVIERRKFRLVYECLSNFIPNHDEKFNFFFYNNFSDVHKLIQIIFSNCLKLFAMDHHLSIKMLMNMFFINMGSTCLLI